MKVRPPRLLTALAILMVLFLVMAAIAHGGRVEGLELQVFRALNNLPNGLRLPAVAITTFGDGLFAGAVVLVIWWFRRPLALQLLAGGAVTFVLVEFLKRLVGRPRPAMLVPDVHTRVVEHGLGFPSGHTAMITVLSLTLALNLKGRWRWVPLVAIPLVGLSRVYLGVHAPLDVAGGCCLGAIVVLGTRLLLPGRYLKTLG